jgi:uncharacterized protein YbjT (DUF2867 family)
MTILVSNANGKVGQEVVKALIAAGQKVRIGARDIARAKAEFPGADVVELDFAKPATLAAAVAGVSAVFAATPYQLLPDAEIQLIAAAKTAGVPRIVKMSALGVEANPESPHSIVEAALAKSGLSWTVLRPTFFMQNYSTMSAGSIKAGAIYEPAAEGASSFIDARDIADVAVAVLTKPGHEGKAYALTGPAALTRAEVAAELSKASGREVKYIAVDDAALRAGMAGAPPSLIELMSTLFGYVRQGYTAGVSPDVEKVLGRPARDFASFAADHAQVWR